MGWVLWLRGGGRNCCLFWMSVSMFGCVEGAGGMLPLSSHWHRSFCELVCSPPRYLYINMGASSNSSSRYFSEALLVDVCVLSESPVSLLRSSLVSVVVELMMRRFPRLAGAWPFVTQ